MSLALIDCAPPLGNARLEPAHGRLPMTEPWVSVDVLAQHLGVTRDSVYRWIDRKGLPARKIGKLWKFKLSEVDAWVRTGATAAGTQSNQAPDDSAE
jgi:excisionase family DNA binding protein